MSVPQTTNAHDITSVIANLASRQGSRPKGPPMSGPKRAAVLMLALGEQYGGKVWSLLDDDEVRELSMAMSTLGTVEADVVEDLLLEFVSRMSASGALMGTFDGTERLLQLYLPPERVTGIMDEIRESAERIKALMFTFDDLVKLDSGSAQTLMRHVDKDKLGVALKSANEDVRGFFLGNMSSRAGKMLLDDMAALGPVRLRDVDEAQALLVNLAKDLAAKGEIMLTKNRADEELVY